MANKTKRMFSSVITKQDEFLDMPLSAQALYFHINMEADDEGFVANVRSLMRQVRGSEDDLKILVAKRYLLTFESGVVVVKHWLIHNTIRQDRVIETSYKEEKSRLLVKENMSYTEDLGGVGHLTDKCQPNLIGLYSNSNIEINSLIDIEKKEIIESKEIKEKEKENKETKEQKEKNVVFSVIGYLNDKCNTRYRVNNTRTQAYIKARLSEGYTVEDFKTVIDTKYKEWYGTDMAKYLTPETLFRPSNFEKYLNQHQIDGDNRWDKIDMEDF